MKISNLTSCIGLTMITIFLLNFASCIEEDPDLNDEETTENPVTNPEPVVDITDPNAVTEALTIESATVIEGSLPAPSTDPEAPEILSEDLNFTTSQDGAASISFDVEAASEITGVYFLVEGSSSYFDIPINASGGRTAEDETGFEIDLADAFEPGTFCGEICVYDSEQRISVPVTVCIEIVELGGENSAFLIGTWTLVKSERTEDGETVVINIGDSDIYTWEYGCSDGTMAEVVEEFRTDKLSPTFNTDGSVIIQIEEYEKYFDDYNTTSCANIAYHEEESSYEMKGIWSYDDLTSSLKMVLNEPDEETGAEEQTVLELFLTRDGNTLILHESLDGDGIEKFYFEPAP